MDIYEQLLEMGCKVITGRPQPFQRIPYTKVSPTKNKSLTWRLVESRITIQVHIRSSDELWTVWKDGEKYSLHYRGVFQARFNSNREAREYVMNHLAEKHSSE